MNNGYIDIAYNEIICPHGVRYVGRPRNRRSAANGGNAGANGLYYAYCALRGPGDEFPKQMKIAMRDVAGEIAGQTLVHSDVNATACPGPRQTVFVKGGFQVVGFASTLPTQTGKSAGMSDSLILRRGSAGDRVRSLQTWLELVGFSPGPVDGDFGPLTEKAVRAFQTSAGIQVDGIAGPETFGHLYGALITAKAGTATVANVKNPLRAVQQFIAGAKRTVLRKGSRGAFVVLLQNELNQEGAKLATDGDFGELTDHAVRDYQRRHRLSVDGIVGPQTWGRLIP